MGMLIRASATEPAKGKLTSSRSRTVSIGFNHVTPSLPAHTKPTARHSGDGRGTWSRGSLQIRSELRGRATAASAKVTCGSTLRQTYLRSVAILHLLESCNPG